MDKVKEFFEKLSTDPEARELLRSAEKPGNQEDVLKAYVDLAGKLGIALTEEELKAYLEEEKKVREVRTEAAAAQITELPDEALNAVAGGNKDHDECSNTYKDKENCWFNDGCDNVYHMYDDYHCRWYYYLPGEK